MRTGLIVSATTHAALIVLGVGMLTSAALDSSDIEQIPVDFVQLADDTKLTKGLLAAALVTDAPVLPPAPKPVEEPPPLPMPDAPDAQPAPEAMPPPPPPPPPPQAQPEETPPPAEPTPEAETPPDETAAVPLKDVPLPRVRPKMPPQPDRSKAEMDRIQALIDKRKLDEMAAAAPTDLPPTVGSPDAPADVAMTASELEILRARLARCWNPPIGWTDPAEVRVVLLLSLNPDGTVNGEPKVLDSPQGQYSNTAPESAVRAVLRCAPFSLPAAKYDQWKEVKVTFDPRDMGAT